MTLKRRITKGETRADRAGKWLDCVNVARCGESCYVDGKTTKVTCGTCVMRLVTKASA